jgi:hypothetical protein
MYQYDAYAETSQQGDIMYQVGKATVLDGLTTEQYDEGATAMRMDIGR